MTSNPNLNRKKQKVTQNQYSGYTIPSSPATEITTIDTATSSITAREFFAKFISQRKPVKLVNSSRTNEACFLDVEKFQLNNLQATLAYDDEPLQVEELFQGGFGSGQKRVDMMLGDLLHEFKTGDSELYLTTQYDREGDNEENGKEHKVGDEVEEGLAGERTEEQEEQQQRQQQEGEEEGEGEEEEEEEGTALFEQMSNASSIDMNDLHDDFDDFENLSSDNEDDDSDSEYEAYQRVKTLYQPPLTNLAKSSKVLPTNPPLIPNLIPQQINIWMGKTGPTNRAQFSIDPSQPLTELDRSIPNNGTSSGLHHDHADNLYVLVQGRKRFTIYSPNDASKLYTVGKIHKIFNNGVIDYEVDEQFPNWRSIRDDGAMIEDVLNWQISQTQDKEELEQLNELLSIQESKRKCHCNKSQQDEEANLNGNREQSHDPPSFSKIPPALLHVDEVDDPKQQQRLIEFANTHFPGFLQLKKITVWLEPGHMLYLPASWFHEVSSFGEECDAKDNNSGGKGVHIALNYWFVPPNTDNFDNCYKDQYWQQDWEETKQALGVFIDASKPTT
ncbi:hypothetical protein CANMA_002753 [Candida margitis]|uniref:uncharacterized protein n=1 Tax=Candida margitis TaxID=1775924 RepID=UPI002226A818|nr:uncharacterized protein CANMA_002753 [Candida margitis]KAI5967985.1 hypothetical protein CANMA_002753 [Candida margitis]